MIAFDTETVAQAVSARSNDQKWGAETTLIVSGICTWYATHPDARIGYEDGRPGRDMQRMVDAIARDTEVDTARVLMCFGAAHCLLCDVVPGFRPILFSAWDRDVEDGGSRH